MPEDDLVFVTNDDDGDDMFGDSGWDVEDWTSPEEIMNPEFPPLDDMGWF